MKISELLLEYNEQRLINDFGNKLVNKYQDEFNKKISPEDLIKVISSEDPTPNKELSFWLINKYANNKINKLEDIGSRAIPALLKYKALLKKPNLTPPIKKRDINQLKDLSELENILDNYTEKQVVSNKEASNSEEQNFYKTKQATLLYNDDEVKVVVPHTEDASCFFGINTKWCTASKANNKFNSYNKTGLLYIILIKKENKRFQFHFKSGSFMDETDSAINPQELANQYPILWKIFTPISIKNNSIVLIKNPSEEMKLAAVKNDVENIKYIKNPSEEMKLAAVKQDGYAIIFIKNPSEEMQLLAVRQNGYAIKYIKNPSEEVQLAAVRQHGYAVEFIKNPSEEVQLAAVRQKAKWIRDQIY